MRQNRNYAIRLQDISEALIACGYTKLDKQAKALGVRRSTAWTIVNVKHKLGRLSSKTTSAFSQIPNFHYPFASSFSGTWPKGPMRWSCGLSDSIDQNK